MPENDSADAGDHQRDHGERTTHLLQNGRSGPKFRGVGKARVWRTGNPARRYMRALCCGAEEEPELFWALRGAGHNFGTVVGLELDLVELASVGFGIVWFDPDATTEGLAWCRDHLSEAPDELTTILSVGHPPASLRLPDRLRGRAALHVLACHSGPPEQARRDLAALRTHPNVTADTIQDMSWPELAMGNDVFISGVRRRSRMHYVHDLNDAVIDISTRRPQSGRRSASCRPTSTAARWQASTNTRPR